MEQMTYDELVQRVKNFEFRMSRFDAVAYLIGYQKKLTVEDYFNIQRLHDENYVD